MLSSVNKIEGKLNNLIATLKETFGDGYAYFANLVSDVNNQGGKIKDLDGSKADVADLNSVVAELKSKIDQLSSDLKTLEEEVKDVPSNAKVNNAESMAQWAFGFGILGTLIGIVAALKAFNAIP